MMPSNCTRRRALRAVGAVAALGVAGCSDSELNDPPTPVANRGERVTEAKILKARWQPGERAFDIDPPNGADDDPDSNRMRYEYLTTDEDKARVSYGSIAAGDAFRSFVTNTDLESHALVLYRERIPECYDLVLNSVRKESDDDIHLDFCSDLRPADVECSAENHDEVGYAIRLPFPLENPSGFGVGHSSSCNRGPVPRTPVSTVAGNGSDSQ